MFALLAAMDRLDTWFVQEILPHEAALTRFLKRNWADEAEVPDLRQEAYARAYDAASRGLPLLPKPFLFTIARNLVIDRMRRLRVVSIEAVADVDALDVACDMPGPDRHLQGRDELRRLQAALDRLPPRCREVVVLRKVEQLPQREVAARLGITEDTVEHQVAKGMRILAEVIFGHARRPKRGIPAAAVKDSTP